MQQCTDAPPHTQREHMKNPYGLFTAVFLISTKVFPLIDFVYLFYFFATSINVRTEYCISVFPLEICLKNFKIKCIWERVLYFCFTGCVDGPTHGLGESCPDPGAGVCQWSLRCLRTPSDIYSYDRVDSFDYYWIDSSFQKTGSLQLWTFVVMERAHIVTFIKFI